ncbi:hypothetical protein OAU50_01050 [Planctomycetota bacterium]|nr:hypothetical protein [Planctomycetota bacterium]
MIGLIMCLLSACGSRDRIVDQVDDSAETPTIQQLQDATRDYRLARAKNYLLLVGKFNSVTWALSASKATAAVGKLPSWELSFHEDENVYVLAPTKQVTDPAFSIDALLEISELTHEQRTRLTANAEGSLSQAKLEKFWRDSQASATEIIQGTKVWVQTAKDELLKAATEGHDKTVYVWDLLDGSMIGAWFCFTGEVESDGSKLVFELYGILPKWGWATATIDTVSGEVSIEFGDMAVE